MKKQGLILLIILVAMVSFGLGWSLKPEKEETIIRVGPNPSVQEEGQ